MFGAFAVLLASVGIAGVVAYAVSRRRREIGVGLALGADASSVLGLLGRRIGALVGAGLVVGAAAAFVVARSVDGRLYGVDSLDSGPYLTVVAGFLLLAGAALWVPARRALAVDPVEALRDE